MRFLFRIMVLVWIGQAWAGQPSLSLADTRVARDLTAYTEYLEDAGRTMTLAEVASSSAQARFVDAAVKQGQINFGFSRSAYWLRVRLHGRTASSWLLEVDYPPLDRVDLYVPRTGGGYRHLHSGDLVAFSERPYRHRNLVFPLELPEGEVALYLRVESEGSLTVPLKLWQADDFVGASQGLYAVLALYYGTLLALGVYNLLLYFSIRDRAYLQYVLFVTGMAIGLGSGNGFAQQFIWPEWPAWANVAFPVGYAIAGLFGAQFTRTFLDTRHTAPGMDRALRAEMALFVLALASFAVSYRAGAILVSLGGLVVAVTSFASGILVWRRGHLGARFFLLAWTVLLIGGAVMGMRNFGWLPTNLFTTYAMQIGSTLDLILLSFALADRINIMRREKESAQAESLDAKQKMLEALKRSEEELEARVEMRTRELAAANAHLVENERTLSRLARQDALTGLGNRIALEEEMVRAIGRAGRLDIGVAIMLIDLDRFKPVNDAHGHGVGDEVLRLVAARLRGCTRRTDTVARLGGDEFVVVLEGRHVVTDARGMAEKILACLDAEIVVQGFAVRVGASIGIAVLAGPEAPDNLLRRADQAMYMAKREGGNRYTLDGV